MHCFITKSIKDIENAGFGLLGQDPAPSSRFRILRDILKLPPEDMNLVKAQTGILDVPWVKDLISGQNPNGSWNGAISSACRTGPSFSASEKAIRRGLVLGLDGSSPAMAMAASYFLDILRGEALWDDLTPDSKYSRESSIKTASLLSELDPWNVLLDELWEMWYSILQSTFSSGRYDSSKEEALISRWLGADMRNSGLCLNNGYILTFLASRSRLLSQMQEELLLNRIWQSQCCMGYPGIRLHMPPKPYKKELEQWLRSLEVLSSFKLGMIFAEPSVSWLWNHRRRDGLWDLYSDRLWMLSDGWRPGIRRKMDVSVRILILLRKNWQDKE